MKTTFTQTIRTTTVGNLRSILCAGAAGLLLGSAITLPAQRPPFVVLAQSTFDAGPEGWMQRDTGTAPQHPQWITSGGPTGPFIRSSNDLGWFVAPSAFLGNKRNAYRGMLRFDLKQNRNTSSTMRYDLYLQSGSLQLAAFLPWASSTAWRTFEIPLNEACWNNYTEDRPATAQEFATVLSNLDEIRIRADYTASTGSDTASLDNVQLLGMPSGPAIPELAIQRLAAITIHGEVGTTYRVEFTSKLPATDGWIKLLDIVMPASPHTVVDPDSAAAQNRIYRAVKVE